MRAGSAYADSPSVISEASSLSESNSQNIALLEANVGTSSIMAAKSGQKDKDQIMAEGADIEVADNALVPSATPLGGAGGADDYESADESPSVYVVRKEDAISQIAEMYGVSVSTILWANDMKKGQDIHEGDVLFIPPISGFEYTVEKNNTLKGIAEKYNVKLLEIAQYNGISENASLIIGDKLFIPNAEKTQESDKPVKNLAASTAKDKKYYESHPLKNAAGYYINPVPGYRKSQGIHDKNAVDLAIGTGTPIHAAAAGTVILARNGYNGGYGNLVIISHPNGTETLYAHQSKIAVATGAKVYQGQVIGYVGSTGRSTGPHLHFEVHGARNPGADNSWKY